MSFDDLVLIERLRFLFAHRANRGEPCIGAYAGSDTRLQVRLLDSVNVLTAQRGLPLGATCPWHKFVLQVPRANQGASLYFIVRWSIIHIYRFDPLAPYASRTALRATHL